MRTGENVDRGVVVGDEQERVYVCCCTFYASSVGVQYSMRVFMVHVRTSGWASCSDTSCNYQSKRRADLYGDVGHDA